MSSSRRTKRKHEEMCEDSQLHGKRKNEEEEETVYEQLLSLLGPRRRKTHRRQNREDHSLPPSEPQVDQTLPEPVMDQRLPTSSDEGTLCEDGEVDDGVRGEGDDEVGGSDGEDGGCSEGEENEKEQKEDPFRRHFDHLLTSEEMSSLSSPPLPPPPSHSPPLGLVIHIPGIPDFQSAVAWQPVSLSQMSIKPKLCQNWSVTSPTARLTDLQKHLFPIVTSYKDLLFTQRTVENAEELRRLYVLHILNHVLKTRSRVLKNNHKLLLASKEGRQLEEPRDQGLTRPKVLILLPFRHAALQVVEILTSLLLPHRQGVVHNQRRFRREYGGGDKAERSRVVPKPSSYTAMFTGNTDDCFKLGVAVRGKMLRLFADFYSSDIILASPLGLRTVIGAEGEKKRDYDFLSSVEVLVLDQTDVFLMQNWEHVTHVLRHLHLKPRESHGVDFSRVRLWALNEWSSFYRQTIVLSSLLTPEINSILTNHCSSYEGGVRCDVGREEGSVGQVARQVPQTFVKLSSSLSPTQLPDHRLQHFSSQVLSGYHGDLMKGTVIFIPSYLDFVRVRNLLKKEEVSFASISEYSTMSGVTRARTQFYQGLTHFLLYTERAHFFHRYRLKGVRHVVFYSVPTYPEHYSDLVNMVECQEGSVEVIYSGWEQLALCRVVGGARAQRMMASNDSTHLIVTEHYIKS